MSGQFRYLAPRVIGARSKARVKESDEPGVGPLRRLSRFAASALQNQ